MTSRGVHILLSVAAATLAGAGAVAAAWGASQFSRSHLVDYATFVAGIAGPLWTAASGILIYLAYLAQRDQLQKQERQIQANSDQVAAQNLDRTLYTLIDIRLRVVDGIQVSISQPPAAFSREPPENYDAYGRAGLAELTARLWSSLRDGEHRGRQLEAQGDAVFDLHNSLKEAYAEYYRGWREFLAPLHANALLLLGLVRSAPQATRQTYQDIVAAHMSKEEVALLVHHLWLHEKTDDRSLALELVRDARLFVPGGDVPLVREYREIIFAEFAPPKPGTA